MARQNKRVFFTKVVVNGTMTFEQILQDEVLMSKRTIINGKTVEISHIDNHPTYITGIIVATQSKNIAPTHKPGEGDDYSAVELPDGRGFAYPSVFIYDKSNSVLLYERNFWGISESGIESFFNYLSQIYLEADLDRDDNYRVSLLPIIKTDINGRVRNYWKIKSVELQIAKPTLVREQNLVQNGVLQKVVELADSTNSDKGINVVFKNSTETFIDFTREKIYELINEFRRLDHQYSGAYKDKLKIKGLVQNEDGTIIEDAIDVMLDKLVGYFFIDVEDIASSIYEMERKRQIKIVYDSLFAEMLRSI